jgi:polyisoprenoid-binding protein YceI
MKKVFSFLTIILFSASVIAQTTWKVDPMHSKLAFSVTHLGIADVDGLFKTFNLSVSANQADFSDAVFDLSVDVASINTEVEMRDNHLRSADFFDAEKHAKMIFKSASIEKLSKDKYKLKGNLTLHGVTKPVTLDLWYRGTIEHPQSKAITAGFQVTGSINRADFGVGTNFPPPMISNEVKIKVDGELIKQ